MIEGAIRLNRFGLEQGKLWPALLMAVAVFAPVITWVTANHVVSGQEELRPDSTIELTATPPPMAPPDTGSVSFKIPNEGWSLETSESSTKSVTLVHSPMVLTVDAVAGVKNLTVLFNRKKRDLADAKPAYLVTDAKRYRPTKDLEGLRGDLTGERYGGVLVVVGTGTVAAVVEVTAPLGRLDGEFHDVDDILASLEVST